jgi:predicted hotdog family 3-hydroxylacyl-ACP dehydratase
MKPHGLLAHGGAMMLLDRVVSWDGDSVLCSVMSHLDPHNPLRRDGMLPAVCGLEFALQAAAVHGVMRGGTARAYVAVLRDVDWTVDRLDDPALGELQAAAKLVAEESSGLIYDLKLSAASGQTLIQGRAVIAWGRVGRTGAS